jgi:hypothetical protein
VGLKSLNSLNLTNVYPNNNKKNNKVKSKPLELRSRVKTQKKRQNLKFPPLSTVIQVTSEQMLGSQQQ